MEFYFSWWNVPFEFIFKAWKVNSVIGLLFTCICAFCIGLLFEGLRLLSVLLHKKFYALPLKIPIRYESSVNSDESTRSSVYVYDTEEYVKCERKKNHWFQTVLHVIKVVMSYGMMLAVMTFNAYVALALVFGAGLGYCLFCYKLEFLYPKATCPSESVSRTTIVGSTFEPDPSTQSFVRGTSSELA